MEGVCVMKWVGGGRLKCTLDGGTGGGVWVRGGARKGDLGFAYCVEYLTLHLHSGSAHRGRTKSLPSIILNQ